ncbi:ArdC family protein [Thalassobaculum salexigens]|uniref:ArdC family protein n=1 Tax=Thalassobaculum salexigens TaxID=455360 RepID=UPI00042405F2|nr:zincin-like metallopeptidase domain-containing protein [Thalassobaculum salexigens]
MQINDLYRSVTSRIIEELERGAAPWLKPWKTGRSGSGLMPRNAATCRPYRGINIPILWDAADQGGFPIHAWMTLRQANERGGHVRRGERGTPIVLVKRHGPKEEDGEPDEKATTRSQAMLRTYTVFNVSQIDGIGDEFLSQSAPEPLPVRLRHAWAFVSATGADIRYGFDGAWYAPAPDYIAMPAVEAFVDPESVLATVCHELGHWSGAKHRLDRDLSGRFGSRNYAAEELVAELTSAFLCAELGVEGELRHAGYIDHWIALLREDQRAIFTAAAKASQSADYLHSQQPTTEPADR